MPWWMSFVFLAAGWGFKILYDWKINPAITKSQKKQERKEAEEKKRRKKEREEKINNLNRTWKNDREILQSLEQPLKEFNQMNRFPDSYRAPKCLELASYIEKEAEKIQQSEFQGIKNKLLEYARRKERIDQNTLLKDLMDTFQRPIESNKFEPLKLREEIEEILKKYSTPPYSINISLNH